MSKKNIRRECIACDGVKYDYYSDELVKCTKCGLVVAKHIPTFAELQKLYEEEYFFGMEYSDYIADRSALEKNFKQRINHLSKYVDYKKAKVVEVGCAYGYFLNMIKDKVKWHQGFDVSKDGVKYAKETLGVNATTKDFTEYKGIDKQSIDMICMWDVMEHFGEPDKHIKKASELLKKNGIICFTTGDIGKLLPRIRGGKWRMIHPPTHIYYFTADSAKMLLNRYGLEVVSVRYKSTYRNTGSVFNQLIANKKALNKTHRMLSILYLISKKLYLDKINFPLNLYDVMEVTAVKR